LTAAVFLDEDIGWNSPSLLRHSYAYENTI